MKEDKEVIDFLRTCGEENLQFLLHPPRLKKALEVLDEDGSGEIDIEEWESAIQRGLKKRLEQLADERERRQRAAEKADEEFSLEFLNARPRRPNPLRHRLRRTAAPRRARILRARRLKRAVARGGIDASPTAPLAGRARGISNDRRRRVGHAREA